MKFLSGRAPLFVVPLISVLLFCSTSADAMVRQQPPVFDSGYPALDPADPAAAAERVLFSEQSSVGLEPVATEEPESACGHFGEVVHIPDSNAVAMDCESGKIRVTVSNEQQFANHIGGIVDVKVDVLADESVRIDFQSLQSGTLKFDGTTRFYLARENPVSVSQTNVDTENILYTINLRVQTFVPERSVPFDLDLRYAMRPESSATSLDWKVLTTPSFFIKTSNTKDEGDELLQGNMQQAQLVAPRAIPWLMAAGTLLVSIWPAALLFTWLKRKHPSYKAPANEVAWKTFSRVIREGAMNGYTDEHIRDLTAAFTTYFGIAACTQAEISDRFQSDPRRATILGVIVLTSRVLYGGEKLDSTEVDRLIAGIASLIPRPD